LTSAANPSPETRDPAWFAMGRATETSSVADELEQPSSEEG